VGRRHNLFSPAAKAERLHGNFKVVAGYEAYEPARETLSAAFRLLPSPDPNFIKDFQTTGFDARIWELYLAAYFNSVGLSIEQPHDRPDYLLSRHADRVWVEAVTANPTQLATPSQPEGYWEAQDSVAIKLGSALWSKLNKRYWDLPHVRAMPFVLAIEDFHGASPIRDSIVPVLAIPRRPIPNELPIV
jgi:hypothetical protein